MYQVNEISGEERTATTNIVVTKFIQDTNDLLEVASSLDLNRKGKLIEAEFVGASPIEQSNAPSIDVSMLQSITKENKFETKKLEGDEKGKKRKRLCQRCGESYVRNHELFCQPNDNIKPSTTTQSAVCYKCGRYFSSNFNLKRHMTSCKLCPDKEKGSRFICNCGRTYSQACDMRKHQMKCTGESKNEKCKCCPVKDCKLLFYHKAQLLLHMKRDHGIKIQDPQMLTFSCFDDFLQWKEQEEAETFTYFSKQTGSNVTGVSVNTYYICQHDGSDRNHNTSPRKTERRNKKGRIKTGQLCWSQMNVKEFLNGTVKVTYYPSHTHKTSAADIKHHPLPLSINNEIKRRLSLLNTTNETSTADSTVDTDQKVKRKRYGVTLRALKTLARKNRNFFRVNSEPVQNVQSSEDDPPPVVVNNIDENDIQTDIHLSNKPHILINNEPRPKNDKEDEKQNCLFILDELKQLINCNKLDLDVIKNVQEDLRNVVDKYKNVGVSDSNSVVDNVTREDIKPIVDDSGNAIYQILSDGQQLMCQGVELMGAREFILISADQYFQNLNPNLGLNYEQ